MAAQNAQLDPGREQPRSQSLAEVVITGDVEELERRFRNGEQFNDSLLSEVGRRKSPGDEQVKFCRFLVETVGLKVTSTIKHGQTPLFFACRHGQPPLVEYLLDKGAELDYVDPNWQTPLFYAARYNTACARTLLERRAATNVRDKAQQTPFFYAASHHDEHCCRLLVQHGTDTTVVDHSGRTPLHKASPGNAAYLLQLRIDPNCEDGLKQTAMHFAASDGHHQLVSILLQRSGRADHQDRNGQTPLMWAANKGHVAAAEVLVKGGANPHRKDNYGHSAMDMAKGKKLRPLVELFLMHGPVQSSPRSGVGTKRKAASEVSVASSRRGRYSAVSMSPSWWQAASTLSVRDEEARKRELERMQLQRVRHLFMVLKVHPLEQFHETLQAPEYAECQKAHDEAGRSLLFNAAARQRDALAACRYCVEQLNLNVAERSSSQQTALFEAASEGNGDVCEYLIERGCPVQYSNETEESALHFAARAGQVEAAQVLLRCRADVHWRSSDQQTALFVAAAHEGSSAELVRLLLEARARATSYDANCVGPLVGAATNGQDLAVQALVAAGACVNLADCKGYTALRYAVASSRLSTAEVLLDLGAVLAPADLRHATNPDKFGNHDTIQMAHARGYIAQLDRLAELRSKRDAAEPFRNILLDKARTGSVEDLQNILRCQADPALPNDQGVTTLHAAASRTDEQAASVCEWLMSQRVNPNLPDHNGETPLFYAVRSGSGGHCIAPLVHGRADLEAANRQHGNTPLFEAAAISSQDAIGTLLNSGASLETTNRRRHTVIFETVARSDASTLAFLLSQRANPNATDGPESGRTCLFHVQDVECTRMLIQHRCDVNFQCHVGQGCALASAVAADRHDVARVLLDEGADVNAANRFGKISLHYLKSGAMAKLLLDAGAEKNKMDHIGQTPLFYAASSKDPDAARAMLTVLSSYSVDPDICDSNNQTALFYACSRGTLAAIQGLCQQSWADPTIIDSRKRTCDAVIKGKKEDPECQKKRAYIELAVQRYKESGAGAAATQSRRTLCRIDFADDDGSVVPYLSAEYSTRMERLQGVVPELRELLGAGDGAEKPSLRLFNDPASQLAAAASGGGDEPAEEQDQP